MISRSTGICLSLASLLFAPAIARAHVDGQFGSSGRSGSTCATVCHTGTAPRPTVTVDLVPRNSVLPPTTVGFVPGARYTVSIAISGGPGLRWGFTNDCSAGTAVVTSPTLMQRSGGRPQEVTHRRAGTTVNQWSYDWIAPTTASPVTFWIALNSANNNGSRFGDGIAAMSFVINPVPPEVVVRFGGVNQGAGIDSIVNVLAVNGSAGDDLRRVTLAVGGPFALDFASYPGAPPQIPYVLYALQRENGPGDISPHPFGIGNGCFPTPVVGGQPIVVLNTIGLETLLGRPVFRGTPFGPTTVLSVPSVPSSFVGQTVTIQALVPDSNAANGRGAFTNAIVMQIQ